MPLNFHKSDNPELHSWVDQAKRILVDRQLLKKKAKANDIE